MRLGSVVGLALLTVGAAGACVLLGSIGRGRRDAAEPGRERATPAPAVDEGAPQSPHTEQDEIAREQAPRWVVVTVVENDGGRPVAGARVHASTQMPARENPDGTYSMDMEIPIFSSRRVDVTTDSSGLARVGPIGVGRVTVSASARGFAERDVTISGSEAAAGELAATVRLDASRRIAGRVLFPDGGPASLPVRIQPARDEMPSEGGLLWRRSTTSGADGRFQFDDLPAGEFALAVRTRDGEFAADASVAAGATDVVLRLVEGAGRRRVLVRVVDSDGKPVALAKAEYSYEHANPRTWGRMSSEVKDGRAEFDGEPESVRDQTSGSLVVEFARGMDGGLLPLGRVRLPDVRWGTSVEVRLPAERAIEGRVVGPDGRGVAGARVRAELVGAQVVDYPNRDTSSFFWNSGDPVTTDADGAFRTGHLGDGAHRVFVLPPPAFAFPDPVVVAQGTPRVEVRLRPGLDVTVRVRDAGGAPVAGARVIREKASADPHDRTVEGLFAWTLEGRVKTTDEDGAVTLRSLDASARYVIGIRGPASRADLGEHVDVSWVPADATIGLPRGLSVAGVVRDASGAPVAKTGVACWRPSGLVTGVTTGEDGTFRITGLAPGRVWLSAAREQGAWVEAGAEGVTLVSEPDDR